MILKNNLIAFYRIPWKEKKGKEGDLIGNYGCICVRSSQRGIPRNKPWVPGKKEDT